MERFISWFLANGGRLNQSAEIVADDEKQFYVRVRNGCTLSESETVVSCPHALTFSYASSKCLDPGARATQIDRRLFPQDVALRLLLMEQYLLGEDSFWWPYISILPQPCHSQTTSEVFDKVSSEATLNKVFHTPLYFNEKDMRWLDGTNLGAATTARASSWIREFEAAKGSIKVIDESKQDLWSSDLYIWAATVITSRSFSSSALRIPDLDSPVLIPGVDLLNHSPSAKVTWDWGASDCAVQTDDLLTSGTEIFNNYGQKGNEELLMGYGFCLESNQADSFNLTYSPALSQHIDAAKARHGDIESKSGRRSLFTRPEVISSSIESIDKDVSNTSLRRTEETPIEDIKFLMLSDDNYAFSPGFLADCSLALLNTRERNQPMKCTPDANNFSTTTLSRNKLHTLCSIIMILQGKLDEIHNHDIHLPPNLTPLNKNQEYASIYRSSQLKILSGVLAHLASTLHSLSLLKYPNSSQPRTIHLADILTTITSSSTPKPLRPDFRAIIHTGLGTRDPAKIVQRGGVEFAFAIWICGLRLLYHRQSGEGEGEGGLADTDPVLARWMEFLCGCYPCPSALTFATGGEEEEGREEEGEEGETAKSYIKAVRAATGKHPGSVYADMWAQSVGNMVWCLRVGREESVRCPSVVSTTEGGGIIGGFKLGGEEEDEVVLVVDLE